MLDRVAIRQTRLRLPGLGIDSKGVACGTRGVVLLASLDRLVAFLSFYTSTRSMADLLQTLRIEIVRSEMGTREVLLSFTAEGTERMDVISEVARTTLGHTFTGSNRHYVQYRDASAPFGYDIRNVLNVEGQYVLYHNAFSQAYHVERQFDLKRLILGLQLGHDPSFGRDADACLIVAEEGVGSAIIQYFVRSGVDARVGMVELPPLSAFDDTSIRKYLFDVPAVPKRMVPMLHSTPGIEAYAFVAPGTAVQHGFRHPITLAACPIFQAEGMVLFRGNQSEHLVLSAMPAMGAVSAFARVAFRDSFGIEQNNACPGKSATAQPTVITPQVTMPVRLVPSGVYSGDIRATFIPPPDYPVLRQLLYRIGRRTMRTATIAFVDGGAFLLCPSGAESTPIGHFLREIRSGLYVAAGYDLVPSVDPEVLHDSLGSPRQDNVFLLPDQPAIAIPKDAFVPLQRAMIEANSWIPSSAAPLEPLVDSLALELESAISYVVFDSPTLPLGPIHEGE